MLALRNNQCPPIHTVALQHCSRRCGTIYYCTRVAGTKEESRQGQTLQFSVRIYHFCQVNTIQHLLLLLISTYFYVVFVFYKYVSYLIIMIFGKRWRRKWETEVISWQSEFIWSVVNVWQWLILYSQPGLKAQYSSACEEKCCLNNVLLIMFLMPWVCPDRWNVSTCRQHIGPVSFSCF